MGLLSGCENMWPTITHVWLTRHCLNLKYLQCQDVFRPAANITLPASKRILNRRDVETLARIPQLCSRGDHGSER